MRTLLCLLLVILVSCGKAKTMSEDIKTNGLATTQIVDIGKPVYRDVLKCPEILDSAKFINGLISACELEIDSNKRKVAAFKKVRIYEGNEDLYFLELTYQGKTNVLFPWKYQLLFNKKGYLIFKGSDLNYEFIEVFPKAAPLYVTINATSKGHGGYLMYKVKNDSLINILDWKDDYFPNSYDSDKYDESYNSPSALILNVVKKVDPEIHFKGKVLLMRKGYQDCDKPCGEFDVEMIFKYDSTRRQFTASEDYSKKYKLKLEQQE